MALEFTGRPDRHGPALYLIDKGRSDDEKLIALGVAVDDATSEDTQVVYLKATSAEAQKITSFYAVTQFPAVLIVLDNAQLAQSWTYHLPRAEEVIYAIGRAGARMRGDQSAHSH